MSLIDPYGTESTESPRSDTRSNWVAVAAFLLSLLAFLINGMRSYGDDSSALKQRISVVETQQQNANQRMERMENKIDRILERVQ